jgi:hypothetical protein
MLLRCFQISNVADDALPNRFAKFDGHGVPDEAANRLDIDRRALQVEVVVTRKTLKNCSLSEEIARFCCG